MSLCMKKRASHQENPKSEVCMCLQMYIEICFRYMKKKKDGSQVL